MENPSARELPKLVWAVDPYQSEIRPSADSFAAIRLFAKSAGWEIQPVTVVSPTPGAFDPVPYASAGRAQLMLDDFLRPFRLPAPLKGKVLVADAPGQLAAVEKLVSFSELSNAAAIAVSSHGRSGIDRMVLGSFAEKTLETSPLPVFFLRHDGENRPAQGNNVLLATDFGAESHAAFRRFLGSVEGGELRVVLYHAVTQPVSPGMTMGMVLPDDYLRDQKAWADTQADRWVREARERGVDAEAVVHVGGIGYPSAESILAVAAGHGARAIVMTTNSSVVGRALLGSVAFPVFRANRCLTMMYGPKAVALARDASASRPRTEPRPEGRSRP